MALVVLITLSVGDTVVPSSSAGEAVVSASSGAVVVVSEVSSSSSGKNSSQRFSQNNNTDQKLEMYFLLLGCTKHRYFCPFYFYCQIETNESKLEIALKTGNFFKKIGRHGSSLFLPRCSKNMEAPYFYPEYLPLAVVGDCVVEDDSVSPASCSVVEACVVEGVVSA